MAEPRRDRAQHRRRHSGARVYLGGTAVAISLSIPAGLSALIPGLQPILTSTIANRWLGERVTAMQWGGLLIGLAGVALILHDRPMGGQAGWGWIASAVSLVSITLGTLYQRRYCSRIDWRSGNLVQYVAVTVFFAIGAFLFEARVVHWTTEFILALVWLAVVLSIGSIGLLYWLIRHSGRDIGGEPVLSGARRDLADGLRVVRRAARCRRDCRHGRLRRRRAAGQSRRACKELTAADRRVRLQRAFAPRLVIDDRLRIGLAELDAIRRRTRRREIGSLILHFRGMVR